MIGHPFQDTASPSPKLSIRIENHPMLMQSQELMLKEKMHFDSEEVQIRPRKDQKTSVASIGNASIVRLSAEAVL